jgi:hypothetical protein
MKTMHISMVGEKSGDGFWLVSKDKIQPAICKITDLRFHDTDPLLHMVIDWVNVGSYTNGQRKKLVARTLVRTLRRAARHERNKRKHTKEHNV